MGRPWTRLLVTLACALAAAGTAPSLARAVVLGIADQNAAMFSDPRFLALGITTARDIVPWDVATRPADRGLLRRFEDWLTAARHAGISPLVSFGADIGNPAANYVPTVAQYRRAVRAFLHRFPRVRTYTAWNEPDFSYRHLARDPALAAGYFDALVQLCRRCTVLAGDVYLPTRAPAFIDGAVARLAPWLRAYIRALHHRPAAWALHDYSDVRDHSTSQLVTLLSMTTGPVWLDETGGVVTRGHVTKPVRGARAAGADERFLLSLVRRHRRIARIYHYEWQGSAPAGWDSGLIAPDGRPRPAYEVLLSFSRGARLR